MTARRTAGESSISKGADGRWHGYVSMGLKDNGQRDRRHVAAVKRADVVAQVKVIEDQRDAGIVLACGKVPTVEQWLSLWLDTIASRRIRPSTATGYRSCLTRINRDLGHHRMDRLQPEQLEAFYNRLSDEGLAAATVLLHHRVLSRALKVAMQRGRIARNVATLVDAPTVVRDEVRPLSATEARRILDQCRGSETLLAGRWPLPSASGRGRRSARPGATSTSTRAPGPSGRACSGRPKSTGVDPAPSARTG